MPNHKQAARRPAAPPRSRNPERLRAQALAYREAHLEFYAVIARRDALLGDLDLDDPAWTEIAVPFEGPIDKAGGRQASAHRALMRAMRAARLQWISADGSFFVLVTSPGDHGGEFEEVQIRDVAAGEDLS